VATIQPAPSRIDLHCHSTASDGLLTPAALVSYASERGVDAIGLTDHDSTNGVAQAMAVGAELGVTVVPGVELSSEIEGLQAHILGYFIDPDSESLQAEFAWMNRTRRERISRIVQNLNAAGIPISVDDVFAQSGDGTVGRPHVARVLIANGYAESVSDAFDKFLTRGKPGYAVSEKITPEGAIRAINRAGGVAVLAHPWSTKDPRGAVARLAPVGLSGLECYYGEYARSVQLELVELANQFDLIPTGGSDFHGPGVKSTDLGAVTVPSEAIEQLRAAAEAVRSTNFPSST
jgi:predicted metal-dependent phosphoesterase TrpH